MKVLVIVVEIDFGFAQITAGSAIFRGEIVNISKCI